MSEALMVFCTCEDRVEARRIASHLVEERLAACVNILAGVESVYRWEGTVSKAEEVQLLIKTVRDRYPALQRRITELHSYDTPEIVAVAIADGSEKYLRWLQEQV
jgi:periplasmic divalent cation tolerance protein